MHAHAMSGRPRLSWPSHDGTGSGKAVRGAGIRSRSVGSAGRPLLQIPKNQGGGWRHFSHIPKREGAHPSTALRACPEPVEGTGFLAFSARSGAFRNPEFGLLRWDQIKFAGRLFVEQRAFFLISAAPRLVPSGNTYEVTRAHALLAGVVLVQIGALDHATSQTSFV